MSDLISFEQDRVRSWLDACGVHELSSRTAAALADKAEVIQQEGRNLLFVTLTYAADAWLPIGLGFHDATGPQLEEAAEACWDSMNEGRHVARFVGRLEAAWDIDLQGRWWSKREFTKAGFLHHHMLLSVPKGRHDFRSGSACWVFGRSKFETPRSSRGTAVYVAKYAAKGEHSAPGWLLNRPCGSVRFTTSASGWWKGTRKEAAPADSAGRTLAPAPAEAAEAPPGVEDLRQNTREELDELAATSGEQGETIGEAIERKRRTVVLRGRGKTHRVQGVTLEALRAARVCGDDLGSHVLGHRLIDVHAGGTLLQAVADAERVGWHFRRHTRDAVAEGFHEDDAEAEAVERLRGVSAVSLSFALECAQHERRERKENGPAQPAGLPWWDG